MMMNLILLSEGLPLFSIATFNQAQADDHSSWHLFIAEPAKLNYQQLLNQ